MNRKELLAKIRKLEIRTRRLVDAVAGGAYHSVFKGQGIEFSEVREYTHGDEVRDIDWNVTARTGLAHVKKYEEERELNVILAVDVSRSCAFGSGEMEKRETMASVGALLALSAVRNHDKAGLMLFTDQTELILPPRQGRTHTLRLIRELLAGTAAHTGTDIASAMSVLAKSLKKRSIIFFLSDFSSGINWTKEMAVLAAKHDLVLIRVTDPLEMQIPAGGVLNLCDAESGERIVSGKSHFPEEHTAALQKAARKAKVDFIEISAQEPDIVRPMAEFFRCRVKGGGR